MAQNKTRHAPPKASAMVEALRGLGYSAATALADIIDNSVAAHSKKVDLQFSWFGEKSFITVLDNGDGMDDAELDRAMRLGDKSPLDERHSNDLGRFGLGLKTASFSQCRSVTVASKKNSVISCLRWDLDFLSTSKDDGWHLLEGTAEGSEHLIHSLNNLETGTIVILEKLDKIITPGFQEQDFLDLVDTVERHLSMVFHRYLDGRHPKISIAINDRPIKPWDPFLKDNPATWTSPMVKFPTPGGIVEVQCYVLPHKDKLEQQEYDLAAGPDGWTAQQGFYVYRNQRLLVAGSWLGLGHGRSWTKEEAHRLARIRLDIPNTADMDWKIDIRKSIARPPVTIRASLTRIAEDTRSRARRVFASRGQISRLGDAKEVAQAWRSDHSSGGVRYRIDHDHPAIRSVLDDAGPLIPQISAMLRIIEETIPVQRIWLDTAEAKETPPPAADSAPSPEMMSVLDIVYRNMIYKKGFSPSDAREKLLHTEPFNDYPDVVAALPDNPAIQGEINS